MVIDIMFHLLIILTKHCWYFPMKNKSDVRPIFIQLSAMLEKIISTPIKNLYTDNGGEFIALRSFLATHGISHYTTSPHTAQQNGTVERRHCHIVETSLTLLHHASVPSNY